MVQRIFSKVSYRKTIHLPPIQLATLGLCVAALLPAQSLAQSNMPDKETVRPGIISVSGIGNVDAAPDMALINLGIEERAKTAREALDANNKKMAAIFDALKKQGIEDKDFQTSNFSIQPVYQYSRPKKNEPEEPPEIVAYQVSNQLTIRVRNLGKLGEIMDQSVTLGVNQSSNISFTNSKSDELINQARKKAMENAVSKAKTLTETVGAELGRIVKITEGHRAVPVMRAMHMAADAEMASAPASVPVAAGEGSYTVTVNVEWEIAQ